MQKATVNEAGLCAHSRVQAMALRSLDATRDQGRMLVEQLSRELATPPTPTYAQRKSSLQGGGSSLAGSSCGNTQLGMD